METLECDTSLRPRAFLLICLISSAYFFLLINGKIWFQKQVDELIAELQV